MQETVSATITERVSHQARLVLAAFAAAVLALFVAVPQAAHAHDELVGYSIQADTATGAAKSMTLSFNNVPIEVGGEITVVTADDIDLTDGEPQYAGRDVVQNFVDELPEGMSAVTWRIVSSDGHPISGAFALVVEEDG